MALGSVDMFPPVYIHPPFSLNLGNFALKYFQGSLLCFNEVFFRVQMLFFINEAF